MSEKKQGVKVLKKGYGTKCSWKNIYFFKQNQLLGGDILRLYGQYIQFKWHCFWTFSKCTVNPLGF